MSWIRTFMELGAPQQTSDPGWVPIEGYVCGTCSSQAHHHPGSTGVWACLRCDLITASVALYFRHDWPDELVGMVAAAIDEVRVMDTRDQARAALQVMHDQGWLNPGMRRADGMALAVSGLGGDTQVLFVNDPEEAEALIGKESPQFPEHLRDNARVLHCSDCGRETVVDAIGQLCDMIQPDGSRCTGTLR